MSDGKKDSAHRKTTAKLDPEILEKLQFISACGGGSVKSLLSGYLSEPVDRDYAKAVRKAARRAVKISPATATTAGGVS